MLGMLPAALAAARPPRAVQHVLVYRQAGRFGGWPANHGIWSWGNEILVGFSRGYYKDLGERHNIDRERPEEYLLARSLDGPRFATVGSLDDCGGRADYPTAIVIDKGPAEQQVVRR